MWHKLAPALIVTRREVRDQFRDWRILLPILVLTLFFPALMNFTAREAVSFVAEFGAAVIGDRLIPFLLMVVGFFPISVSLVIALESFVGEKERRSIEPLLSSPLTDLQLYLGKLIAVMLPPLLASYLGIGVYLYGVYRQVGWTPEPVLLIQIVALTTVQSLLMVSGAVVISSQATSTRAANLLASFIIVPMAMLLVGESMIMFWARYHVLWWAIFGQILISGLLVRTGIAHFNREELLGRELDSLNFKWSWQVFWGAIVGDAQSVSTWLHREFSHTLKRIWLPLILIVISFAGGAWVGVQQAQIFRLPPDLLDISNIQEGFVQEIDGFETLRFFSVESIPLVWMHNLRTIALATFFGIFSFGVMGIIVLMLPFIIIGYFTFTAAQAGISPILFLTAFVLPHGILEIPAIALAGAAILRLGATLSAPAENRTIGEALLHSLADWVKVMIILVVPLLLGAAILEVFVTPSVALRMFGN
ncbi:MAG: stage II sporulation protein M [Anaerolineales bacterium]|nr:stage II sporulation protein M [Chloroflexota bacterium]MBL6981328.1 stage II sporulation protein M [Anaerolineales bacterium]